MLHDWRLALQLAFLVWREFEPSLIGQSFRQRVRVARRFANRGVNRVQKFFSNIHLWGSLAGIWDSACLCQRPGSESPTISESFLSILSTTRLALWRENPNSE